MIKIKQDLKGKRFGRWLVLERAEDKKPHSYWLCECDCGTLKIVRGKNLTQKKNHGSGSSRSCGCLRLDKLKKALCLKSGTAAFNSLYGNYKRGALKRNLIWALSKKVFKSLTKQNCFYCAAPPRMITKTTSNNGVYLYNGIDRVNNSLGYTINNCVSCCKYCNRMKTDMDVDDFINHINKIYERTNKYVCNN